MGNVYRNISILILSLVAAFSLQSVAYGKNPACEPSTGKTIHLKDNEGNLKQILTLAPNSTSSTVRTTLNYAITSVAGYPKDESSGRRGTLHLSKGTFTSSALLLLKEGVTLQGTVENGNPVTTLCTESKSDPVTIKMASDTGVKNIILDGKRRTEDSEGNPKKYYSSRHRGIEATAIDQTKSTDDLVSTYPTSTLLRNITIEDTHIIGYEGYGIYLERVKGVTIKGSDPEYKRSMKISDIGYGGIGGYSVKDVTVQYAMVTDIMPGATVGSAQQSYGMAFSHRKDHMASPENQAKFPRSQQIRVDQNVVANNPTWEGIDTHSGYNVQFTKNVILNTRFPIVVGGMDYDEGKISAYPPRNITISGNRINSDGEETTDDYTKYGIKKDNTIKTERGISLNGTRYTDLYKTKLGFLEGAVILGNYVNNVHAQVETKGGISILATKNAEIRGNTVENSLYFGIVLLGSNNAPKIQGNIIRHDRYNNPFIQSRIGIRSSLENGNPTNDNTTNPRSIENIQIDNDFTEVGNRTDSQTTSEYNLLHGWISLTPVRTNFVTFDWTQYETIKLMQDK
ncbi:hypothetical protein [Peribacillus sp. NPDC097895]|uniref:hypothetical protein n=1 Tax=Peribacillus sp. NPDC097895 TaxID=3390619 RepID=UPI003D0760B1